MEMQDVPVNPRSGLGPCRLFRWRDVPIGLFHIFRSGCEKMFVEPILPPSRRAWIKAVLIETFAPRMHRSRIETIETATGQKLCIAHALIPETIAKCNPQNGSCLFNKLPPEIRRYIFELATAPYPNPAYLLSERDINYRPGYEGLLVQSTAILHTCRLAWLEANALVAQQSEHCFWFRECRSGKNDTRPRTYMRGEPRLSSVHYDLETYRLHSVISGLSAHTRRHPHHLHTFGSIAFLQALAGVECGRYSTMSHYFRTLHLVIRHDLHVKHFTVTVRHFDWWDWGGSREKLNMMFSDQNVLQLDTEVVRQLLTKNSPGGIKYFHLQLETVEHKVDQLLHIIARLQEEFLEQPVACEHSGSEGSAWLLQKGCNEEAWTGPANGRFPNAPEYAGLDRLEYRHFTLTWKCEPALGAQPAVQTPKTGEREEPKGPDATDGGPKQMRRLRQKYERRFVNQNSLVAFV